MIVLLCMAVVVVIFVAILAVFVGIVKGIQTMAIFMDDFFRWGGKDG